LPFKDFDVGININIYQKDKQWAFLYCPSEKETMGVPLLSFKDFDSGIQKKVVGEKYCIQ
jgi:hypothetical protein